MIVQPKSRQETESGPMQIFDEENGVLRWKVFAAFHGISPPSGVSLVEVLGYCKGVRVELSSHVRNVPWLGKKRKGTFLTRLDRVSRSLLTAAKVANIISTTGSDYSSSRGAHSPTGARRFG